MFKLYSKILKSFIHQFHRIYMSCKKKKMLSIVPSLNSSQNSHNLLITLRFWLNFSDLQTLLLINRLIVVLYVKDLLQKEPLCRISDIVLGQLRSAVWCECASEMCLFLCQQFCRSSLLDLSVLSNDTPRLLRWLRDPTLWGFSQRIYKLLKHFEYWRGFTRMSLFVSSVCIL